MADFYSFEYFDEPPVAYGDDIVQERRNPRKNQSLSNADTEFLREAMRRLVPSNYVYGGSGVGERAYELYGLCISHSISGKRSSHLLAAVCVMHATYERNSDLVITHEDIEAAYKPLRIRQIRVHNIKKMYELMCDGLNLPKLEVSSEKLFGRVFRDCCDLPESDVLLYTHTALTFEAEIKATIPQPRTDHLWASKSGELKGSSRCQVKPITIVALAAIYTLRSHNFRDVTTRAVLNELHVSAGAFFPLSRRFRNIALQKQPVDPESTPIEKDEFGLPKTRSTRRPSTSKSAPFKIGDDIVPSGYSLQPRNRVAIKRDSIKEEIMHIAPIEDLPRHNEADDHLALLYLDDSLLPAALPPPASEVFPTSQPVPPSKRPRKVKETEQPVVQQPPNDELDLLFAT